MALRSGNPTPAQRVKSALAVLVSLVVLLGGLTFVGKTGYDAYQAWKIREDYIGAGGDDITITIPYDTGLNRIGDILQSKDVIRSTKTWSDTLENYRDKLATLPPEDPEYTKSGEPEIQAGTYKMKLHWPCETALKWLVNPEHRITEKVMVPEGKRSWEIKQILSDSSGLPLGDFTVALGQPQNLGLPAYATAGVEGYLFPDTYEIVPSATEMLTLMVDNFKAQATELGLEPGTVALNESLGLNLTANDIVTVASIIEREVNIPDDRFKVARAIYNRLKSNMDLQLDSTIIYAMEKDNVEDFQLGYDSPYNTYQHGGMPPGPIGNPGYDALDAALNPADGSWLFWVTVNFETGETRFADTAAEHEANVRLKDAYCETTDIC